MAICDRILNLSYQQRASSRLKRYKVKRLVIKPTLRCTASCERCASRRNLHRALRDEDQLSLDQWRTILRDSRVLGLTTLHISGGEPTLYPHLIDLIREGKDLGLKVRLNTNGSKITHAFAEELLEAGLDEACISIYSHEPVVHDALRQCKGLWKRATEAVRIFAGLRDKAYPNFFAGSMTIILRENFRDFDKVLSLHRELGSQQIGISYLEGDFAGENVLTREEIAEFRQDLLPKLLSFGLNLDPPIRELALSRLAGIYGDELGPRSDLEQGIYWTRRYCDVPKSAALIMANGDVHPCNIVEYAHKPVIGNLRNVSFPEIWNSEAFASYRRALHVKCRQCPVNIYAPIPLSPEAGSHGPLVSFYHSRAFGPLRPLARRIMDAYRELKQSCG